MAKISTTKRVAIEGAGITGPAAALALATAGYEVHVFEARAQNDVWSPGVVRMTAQNLADLRGLGLTEDIAVTEPAEDIRITVAQDMSYSGDRYKYPEGFQNVVWGELHDSLWATSHRAGAKYHWQKSLPESEPWDFVVHTAGVGYAMHRVKASHQEFTPLGYSAFRMNSSLAAPAPWTGIKRFGSFILNLAETRQGFTHAILYLGESENVHLRTMNLSEGNSRLARMREGIEELIPDEFRKFLDPSKLITPVQVSPLSYWTMPPLIHWNGEDYGGSGIHVDAGDAIAPVSPHTGKGANLGVQEALRLPAAFADQAAGLKAWVEQTLEERSEQNQLGLERARAWMHVSV